MVFPFKKGLNVLIGHNNAGKSNFIRAFQFLLNKFFQLSKLSVDNLKLSENQIELEIVIKSSNVEKKEFHLGYSNQTMSISVILNIETSPSFKFFLSELAREYPNKDFEFEERDIDSILTGKTKIKLTIRTQSVERADPLREKFINTLSGTALYEMVQPNAVKTFGYSQIFMNEYGYGKFKTFLSDNLLLFQEFRGRPTDGESNERNSTSGSKLNSVIYNLKNSTDATDQKKFSEIKNIFYKSFEVNIFVSKGSKLEFYNTEKFRYDSEGIGGGLMEFLNILTHMMAESNKIFIIDEPELHLHPHHERALRIFLNRYSKNNQIIITTHSSNLVDPISIENIRLLRLVNNKTKLSRFDENLKKEPYIQRTLLRLTKAEHKEFFFAKKVLLVEGQTERGAIPIFATKLNLDFDLNSISIIPIETNYFVSIVRLLKEFEIPSVLLYDIDVLLGITGSLTHKNRKIRVSSFFEQINEINELDEKHLDQLNTLQSYITLVDSKKDGIPLLKKVLEEIPNSKLHPKIESFIHSKSQSVYNGSIKNDLLGMVDEVKPRDVIIRFSDPDFEGIFVNKFPRLYEEAKKKYKSSKILQGYHMATKIEKKKIPDEIKNIIRDLKNA